jgi:Ca2+-binding RTX toxin-like protein
MHPLLEPLESRLLLSVDFFAATPVAPAVNFADRPLGTMGGFVPIEPMVSVNDQDPGNIITTSHIGMRISTDHGQIFAATNTFGNPPGTNVFNGDTDTTFDSTGRLFWVNMAGTGTAGISVNEINPTTGAVISRASVSNNNDDKPMIVTDANPDSPFRDNLYLVWTQFGVAAPQIMFSRSTDHGVNWSAPQQLSVNAENFVWPSDVGVGPNGDVYVTYHSQPGGTNPTTGTNGQTFVLRSMDGGLTFPQKTLAFTPSNSDISYNVQTDASGQFPGTQFWTQGAAQPWVLPDPVRPENVYVITTDDPDNTHGAGDDADIVISRSTDFGQTWTTSAVSSGPENSFQLFPSASIDRFGNIAVAWYENRGGATNGAGRFLVDVVATYSIDGGLTWAPEFQVNDVAFDPDPGAVNRFNGPPPTTRIGEYFGIDLYGGTAYVAWNGNSFTGTAPTGQQVVFDSFSIAGSVTVTGDAQGFAEDDVFTVRRITENTNSVEVLVNGQREYVGLLSGWSQLDINGVGGNDQLIIDSSNGLLTFASGIRFDGGHGFDQLQLLQMGGMNVSDTYSVGPSPGSGISTIVGPDGTQTVFFEELSPVLDLVPAAVLTINATAADSAINYSVGPLPTNGLVTIDEHEPIEFGNKTTLTINAGAGQDTISLNNPSTPTGLTGITINGGNGNDTINGGDGNDVLSGGRGDDNINTGQGDDVVFGGQGNDRIGGMAGRDVVMAGAGDDFIAWNDPTGDVVFGGRGNDTILGGDIAADEIHGGAGDDLIQAFATSPESATASDTLFGDAGDDTVIGGNAADTIEGGRGDDFLTGNGGADVFIFRDNRTGEDVITDFDPSEDVVQLVGFDEDFDSLAALSATTRGAELDLGGGDSVLFMGRTVAEFSADDFQIV